LFTIYICFNSCYFCPKLVDPYNKLVEAVIVGAVMVVPVIPVIFPQLIVPVVILLDDTNIYCFNPLSTYILLVRSLFSIGVVFETVILLQVKSSDDTILGYFSANPLSTYILLVSSSISVVSVFVTGILLQVKLSDDTILGGFSANTLSTYILLVSSSFFCWFCFCYRNTITS